MNPRNARDRLLQQETLNFVLTNRVPRVALTRLMGWYSRLESPLLARLSIGIWRLFTDLDLSEAEPRRWRSLHECFTRALKPGLRPVDPDPAVLTSPSDGIVGACGRLDGVAALQAKGLVYRLADLLGSEQAAEPYRDGSYVTLRLTSSMYHRFHAPQHGTVEHVTSIGGDAWNVNPPALKRVPGLYCRNERAAVRFRLDSGPVITLVPVAAILVASLRLHWLDRRLHLKYRGPRRIACSAAFTKGQEMGWFEHGSTIIVFAPKGFELAAGIENGRRLRMGEALMRSPAAATSSAVE